MKDVRLIPDAWDDVNHWCETDRKKLAKIFRLIEECRRHPFTGTGKPEPLKGEYTGYWSRRIDQEHRLIYGVTDTEIIVLAARYHYGR